MDAWRNGGMFEGAPATDERMLEYWRKRLAGISPKDPLYDQYKNTVLQFEYAIAESKNDLAYRRGEITAEQRGQFFLDWAKKVPQDSELWRTLQKNAAQFLQQTKAAASGSASQARAQAAAAADQTTYDQYEAIGSGLTSILTDAAKRAGLIGENEDLLKLNFQTRGGAGVMVDLIRQIGSDPRVIEWLKTIDPSFSGSLTFEYYQQALVNQKTGQKTRYDRAVADGRTSDAKKLASDIQDLDTYARKSAMWDSAQSYLEARKTWLSVWEDPSASPVEKLRAWATYRDTLLALASDTANPVDDTTKAALEAEANLDPSVDPWYDNYTRGTSIGANPKTSDTAGTAQDVQQFLNEYAQVTDGTGAYTWAYGTRTDKGFVPSAGGRDIGAVPTQDAIAAGAQPVLVPQRDGSTLTVMVAPQPVVAVARNADGNKLDPVTTSTANPGTVVPTSDQVGSVYDIWVGGNRIRVYSYRASDGTTRYTTESPWRGIETNDKGKVVVDVSASVGDNLVQNPLNPAETKGFDPAAAAKDVIRDRAGVNEKTDYLSPLLAALATLPIDDRQKISESPALREQIVTSYLSATAAMPAGQAKQDAFVKFIAQLDALTVPNVAGQGGIVAPYDNRTNDGAFAAGDTSRFPTPHQAAPETVASSEFGPLAQTMTVAGRIFSYPRTETQAMPTPQITQPTTLKIPGLPEPAPPPVMPVTVPPPTPVYGPAPGAYTGPPVPTIAPPVITGDPSYVPPHGADLSQEPAPLGWTPPEPTYTTPHQAVL